MADVSAALADYLGALGTKRWRPGVLDCGVFMADWIERVTGADPIADVRGSYRTEKQFLRIVRGEGGFAKSCAWRLKAVGYLETATADPGDIATVLAPYAVRKGTIQKRPTGAICVDAKRRAVITSDLGVVIAELPTLKIWTFAHG